MGLFWAEKWARADGGTTHEIALNPEVLSRPLVETMATLVHEMCHQWQQDHGTPPRTCYHNREWAAKMEAVGLVPSSTGQPGGKKTGQQMTHFIAEGGPFRLAFDRMPEAVALPWLTGTLPDASKPRSRNKNKVKYLCPCGQMVWGKADLLVVCAKCESEFERRG